MKFRIVQKIKERLPEMRKDILLAFFMSVIPFFIFRSFSELVHIGNAFIDYFIFIFVLMIIPATILRIRYSELNYLISGMSFAFFISYFLTQYGLIFGNSGYPPYGLYFAIPNGTLLTILATILYVKKFNFYIKSKYFYVLSFTSFFISILFGYICKFYILDIFLDILQIFYSI